MSDSTVPPAPQGPAARTGDALRRMTARSRDEEHRASTPLELFFDLCFVVAVAQAGGRLVHAIADGHPGHGVSGYLTLFFAIWWAWMNFSWFASAYDTDDVPYRVTTLVQIVGVLLLAAGVPRAFDDGDFRLVAIGYAVMRLALVTQWLRAAQAARGEDEAGARTTAVRYAIGVTLCQVGWLALLLPYGAPPAWAFLVMAAAELAVPPLAERTEPTSWHPHHIAERYGLFTIIVLGESVSAATVAVQSAVDEHSALGDLLPIAAGGLLIVFSAWWIYFAVPIHDYLASNREAFLWGYGHYAVFTSAAAIGAGLEIAVEQAVGSAHVSTRAATWSVTVPAAAFLFTVWLLHSRHSKHGMAQQLTLPVAALGVLACTWTGTHGVLWAGFVCAGAVVVGVSLQTREYV
ncbi:low temperature requirement protein A [Actinacidiphila rubida]|uniref:Low temperature requirement protein LtrA n=1 Tax=Actinacidiphila rubida TaxID=310780 RepID=A0A1H8DQC8_9ACTN|nr:low temperature requirement protein A [Actinacidiphila rubida]SEN09423.1 Low temperature requirement protein LtrA [Actinacidiphila rubida]